MREAERELLLEHLLQYEQEDWELHKEVTNAHTEKHRMIKKQQGILDNNSALDTART